MIGAVAVILNNSHIRKVNEIGANTVVLNDVPSGAKVIGVPTRIIMK